jgi:MoaA/NifB/PqqE/SkfB family radical SAM enzyme
MASLSRQVNLIRGLLDGETAYTGPFYVDVDLTRRCNMHCLGCPTHSSVTRTPPPGDQAVTEAPLDLVQKLGASLRRLGTAHVYLKGLGEPLLYAHVFDAISVFKQAGCRVELFTNGTLIDSGVAAHLLDSGLDVLRVSLWANNEQEYEKLYPGTPTATFKRTLDNVRLVTGLKSQRGAILPKVILTTPLNRHNCQSTIQRAQLAHGLGCDGVAFDYYRDWDEFTSAALSAQEIQILCRDLEKAKARLESLSLDHNVEQILLQYRLRQVGQSETPCYVGWYYSRMRLDGTIVPCPPCALPMGNLKEATFEAIWNGDAYRSFRRSASTRQGLASLGQHCDCKWCCHARDNSRVHNRFKWVSPFARRS